MTSAETSDPLARAFEELRVAIDSSEAAIRSSPSFGSDIEQAGGYQHLLRSMKKAIESAVLQDADQPYFRILDHWQREGGDNADQRYAFSRVRGGETYRIWGTLGSACRVELQIYGGEPWAQAGQSLGYLAHEAITFGADGSFDLLLSPDAEQADLLLPTEATSVFVRHIYDIWSDADPGHVHIDRVGAEGDRALPISSSELAARISTAAKTLDQAVATWPAFVNARWVDARPPNEMSDLLDTYALGGVKGRWMASGHFALDDEHALIITTHPTTAKYQAVQLTDMWFASLEYANLTSSLTTAQSVAAPDGSYDAVVSLVDPGHPNWLDTGGHTRGVFLLRWDGVDGAIPDEARPTTRVVPIGEVARVAPVASPLSDADLAALRASDRAGRRRHVQRRTNR